MALTTDPFQITAYSDTATPSHSHVYWATFNMLGHFPCVERQTGRLSDRQSAIITFTAPHGSADPQTPGKLPRPLTFPLEKRACYVNGSSTGARFVNCNHYVHFFFLPHKTMTEKHSISLIGHTVVSQRCSAALDHLSRALSHPQTTSPPHKMSQPF